MFAAETFLNIAVDVFFTKIIIVHNIIKDTKVLTLGEGH